MEDYSPLSSFKNKKFNLTFGEIRHYVAFGILLVSFLALICLCTAIFAVFYFVYPSKPPVPETVLFKYLSCGNNTGDAHCNHGGGIEVKATENKNNSRSDGYFIVPTGRGPLTIYYNSTTLSQIGFRGQWMLERDAPLIDEVVAGYVTINDIYEYYYKNGSIAECFAYCGFYLT